MSNLYLRPLLPLMLVFIIGLVVFGAGYGAKRTPGWDVKLEQNTGDVEAMLQKAEALWEQRSEQASLEQAIQLYEQVVAIDKNRRDVFARLSRAYYFLADGFLGADKEKQLQTYDKGALFGEKAMALEPKFKAKIVD